MSIIPSETVCKSVWFHFKKDEFPAKMIKNKKIRIIFCGFYFLMRIIAMIQVWHSLSVFSFHNRCLIIARLPCSRNMPLPCPGYITKNKTVQANAARGGKDMLLPQRMEQPCIPHT